MFPFIFLAVFCCYAAYSLFLQAIAMRAIAPRPSRARADGSGTGTVMGEDNAKTGY
jgi:hypothetical protein